MTTINTFAKLLGSYGVEIPLIQRDYVQGRVHDIREFQGKGDDLSKALLKKYTKEKERRDHFVTQLINALLDPSNKSIQLTFIYGTLQNTNTDKNLHESSLVPLDGQQRLTTLFLLTWLLNHKQTSEDLQPLQNNEDYKSLMKGMKSFRYKTRPSSDAFCLCLVKEEFKEAAGEISKQIQEQSWFGKDWKMDPSVQAMLQMLDEIERQIQGKDVKQMFSNLLNSKGIEFDFLNMENYNLSDALYIKMNARGKQLTEFENWKADFIDFLETNYFKLQYSGPVDKDVLQTVFGGSTPTIPQYFTYAIEHQWTDLFWKYCVEDIKKGDAYPVIDTYFMNVFEELTRIFFFIDNPIKKDAKDYIPSKETRDALYSKEDNVTQLFRCLDLMCQLSDDWFNEMFYTLDNQNTLQNNKVRLFDKGTTNLLTRCVKNDNATALTNTLLFAILCYAKEFEINIDGDFKQFVRCVRNSIYSKAWLSGKDAKMVDDFGINDIQNKQIYTSIKDLINKKQVQGKLNIISHYEAAIEDFDFIRGNLRFTMNQGKDSEIYNMFKAWDNMSDHDKSLLLIAYGFTGHFVKWCSHGKLKTFGRKDAWRPIFVHDDSHGNGHIDQAVNDIIKDYMAHGDLKLLLSNEKNSNAMSANNDFKYYALQYDNFLNSTIFSQLPTHYFSINGSKNEMNIAAVKASASPMIGYHTDPIIYTLAKELEKTSGKTSKKYLTYYITGGERPTLDVYDSPNAVSPIAKFKHVTGTFNNGGWEKIDPITENVLKFYPDLQNTDRIQNGKNIIINNYCNDIFVEKP